MNILILSLKIRIFLKIVKVSVIFKKCDESILSNYRQYLCSMFFQKFWNVEHTTDLTLI